MSFNEEMLGAADAARRVRAEMSDQATSETALDPDVFDARMDNRRAARCSRTERRVERALNFAAGVVIAFVLLVIACAFVWGLS